jgi:fermentation-respiration switch protein FrsA (DUF1100 family)
LFLTAAYLWDTTCNWLEVGLLLIVGKSQAGREVFFASRSQRIPFFEASVTNPLLRIIASLKNTKGLRQVVMMPLSGITVACVVICLFGLLAIFYRPIENFFVFFPHEAHDDTPQRWDLAYEDVFFVSGGERKLHGWFFPLEGKNPVILFCHGNAGNISHRLENVWQLTEQKLRVFIFDYGGYGKSPGKPSESGIYEDALAAYDFLLDERNIPASQIVVFGRSLGAAAAIEVSLKRKTKSLIIESAFTSTKAMSRTLFPFSLLSPILPAHFNNLEKIARVRVPTLVIHGKKDEIVPFSMGRDLFNAINAPKYFHPIEKAGHNDTYLVGGPTYFEKIAAFAKDPSP